MNTKINTGLISFAFTAALIVFSPAWAANNYKFETIGASAGATFAVRLVDAATEQPVTNAHVFVIQRQWVPPTKGGAPRFIDRRIELTAAGNGTYAYQGKELGAGTTVRLAADIEGSPEVEGSVRLNG